jgi:hypothetical protein
MSRRMRLGSDKECIYHFRGKARRKETLGRARSREDNINIELKERWDEVA